VLFASWPRGAVSSLRELLSKPNNHHCVHMDGAHDDAPRPTADSWVDSLCKPWGRHGRCEVAIVRNERKMRVSRCDIHFRRKTHFVSTKLNNELDRPRREKSSYHFDFGRKINADNLKSEMN
jgi:hypothetical protein